jgi:hypothetical protein
MCPDNTRDFIFYINAVSPAFRLDIDWSPSALSPLQFYRFNSFSSRKWLLKSNIFSNVAVQSVSIQNKIPPISYSQSVICRWNFPDICGIWFTKHCINYKSCDSSVGIALGYGLDDRGSRVRFPAEAGNFSLHHCVQNCSRAHPASYSICTRVSFPGGKAARAWCWPLTSI